MSQNNSLQSIDFIWSKTYWHKGFYWFTVIYLLVSEGQLFGPCILFMWIQTYCLFVVAWLRGDPHITTADGKSYTFNGHGEYVLVRTRNPDVEIQVRIHWTNKSMLFFSFLFLFYLHLLADQNSHFTKIITNNHKQSQICTPKLSKSTVRMKMWWEHFQC